MINAKQIFNDMSISYFNENGEIDIINIPISDNEKFVWEETTLDDRYKHPTITSQFDRPVKRIRKNYLTKYRQYEYINNSIPVELQNKIFSDNKPKKWFWDIETEIINGVFPDASNPIGKILLHTICDEYGNGTIFGMKNLTGEQLKRIEIKLNNHLSKIKDKKILKIVNLKYRQYQDEYSMNYDFITNFMCKMPVIFGWNVLKFDCQYFFNRCKRLGIDYVKILSPVGKTFSHSLSDKYNKDQKTILELPLHRPFIDYMQIFEFFDQSVAYKTSMSLGFISNEVLGVTKIEYNGNLQDLYDTDFEKFCFYGITDAFLVEMIDEKTDIFSLMQTITNIGKTDLLSGTSVSIIIESIFSDYYYKNYNKIFIKEENIKEGYAGAFVVEPTVGLYEYIGIYDFESLYPSIMQFLNIGLDTYIGQTYDDKTTVITKTGEQLPFDKTCMIRANNGVVYTNNKDGCVRTILNNLITRRLTAKYANHDISHDIEELKKLIA